MIDEYQQDRVMYPELHQGSRYTQGGLSFKFRSKTKLKLADVVKVLHNTEDVTFAISGISLAHQAMGCEGAYIYSVRFCGYGSPDKSSDFDLRKFKGKVIQVTDPEELKQIHRASAYC